MLLYILSTLFIGTYSVLPTWNVKTSAIDLLNGKTSYTYTIDNRDNWYESSDKLEKTLKKSNDGKITHENTFTMYGLHHNANDIKFNGKVEFEAIESFYADTNSNTVLPLVCPRGKYNPIHVTSTTTMSETTNTHSDWEKNAKFDLKCYYHRSNGGHFLVYYLMNENNHLLELKSSNLSTIGKYRFEVDEIYDFKLANKESWEGEWGPYPFIGLVKRGDYLSLIGTSLDFFTSTDSQNISSYTNILKIKKYTQAYFHVFHYNNDFYYFTYTDIFDFSSGYSTKSIRTDWAHPPYNDISDVTFQNNEASPFEFQDEVEVIQMENIFNYKYVYYTIRNKVTNVIYHGVLDIKLNKVVFNTDEEVKLFIPYITYINAGEQGGYEHSNSMLMITNSSAYRVCAIKNAAGDDCVEECSSDQKILYDVDGNKCVGINDNCGSGKINLIPENICVSQCNTSIYTSNGTHCGLCRDMDNGKKYKFINGTECLSEIPTEGAKLYNENLSLLICDSGYILQDNTCKVHCFNTCETCFDYSENEK